MVKLGLLTALFTITLMGLMPLAGYYGYTVLAYLLTGLSGVLIWYISECWGEYVKERLHDHGITGTE